MSHAKELQLLPPLTRTPGIYITNGNIPTTGQSAPHGAFDYFSEVGTSDVCDVTSDPSPV